MSARKVLSTIAGLTLLGGLLAPTGAAADTQPPSPGAVLTEQAATLGPANRAGGMPTSPEPGRQLAAATVTVEVDQGGTRDWVRANVQLAGLPAIDDRDTLLMVGYGHQAGSSCQLSAIQLEPTSADGQSYELLDWVGEEGYSQIAPKPATPFECVAVALQARGGATTYDAFVGPLANTWQAPRLEVNEVTQLGSRQKKLRLVPGEWMPYSVTVANTGDGVAPSLTVSGRGKGLKVRGSSSDLALAAGESTTLDLRVRLTGKQKKSSLALSVDTGHGVTATRTIKVQRAKPTRRPVDGSYRDKSGRVRFQIRKGRITGFRATTTTRCGTYLNPTQTTSTYDFPKTRIPRSGILEAVQRGKGGEGEFTARLSLRAAGTKVTRARFSYGFYMPGVIGSNCSAVEVFTARRTGR